MSTIRILRQRCLRLNNIKRLMSGDHGHHGPMTPPFARLAPFTEQVSVVIIIFSISLILETYSYFSRSVNVDISGF